ncbi:hypothetical protein RF55_23766 [Lasius niger]|uniref:DUF5641 domain-containing protein n=1 Tax=Lasius niger TaxID=67767 RepID=A0A0J7JVR8_LASNI|nr:hypothetical protein RF55_23766 [Lasius niger]
MNRLSRFQTIQKLTQSFWKRWANEYLSNLQSRTKWRTEKPNFEKGQLVLLKNEALPVLKWKLARIVNVHVSKDNMVRVVTVQSDTGIYKRPITQIAPLPYKD